MNDKNKADQDKLRLTLVPRKIINGIARVRMYGLKKYPETGENGWKEIGIDRIRDAAFRHFMAYLNDPKGLDDESGLSHLAHACTNFAFLYEMENLDDDIQGNQRGDEERKDISPK